MTVTEALKEGKKFISLKDSSNSVSHLSTYKNITTPIKHVFKVTMPSGDQYLIFTDDNFTCYYWDSNYPREELLIGIKKEKITVWMNFYNQPEGDGAGSKLLTSGLSCYDSKSECEKKSINTDKWLGAFPVEVEI